MSKQELKSLQELSDAKTWASTCNDIEALRAAYNRSLEVLEITLEKWENSLTKASDRV
jgi:hypothetical protein